MTILQNLGFSFASDLIITILFAAIFGLGAKLILSPEIPAWESRGFASLAKDWNQIFVYSGIVGAVSGAAILYTTETLLYALAIVPVAYMLFFSAWTDLRTAKAPREVYLLSTVALLPILAAGLFLTPEDVSILVPGQGLLYGDYRLDSFIQLALWTLIGPGVFLALGILIGGVGMADIRVLFAAGIGLAWWLGLANMIYLFLAACILQLLANIPAHIFKWGRVIENGNKKRKRRAVQFIPAIAIAFIIGSPLLTLS